MGVEKTKPQFSALFFDLDGTLIDSSQDISDSVNYTLKQLGFPQRSYKEIEQFVGDGLVSLLIKAAGTQDESVIRKAVRIFEPHYLEHCTDKTLPYPSTFEILNFFNTQKKVVISNKPYAMVIKTLRHFEFERYFELILGGDSTKEKKPHPEPLVKSLEFLKIEPGLALMIGDGTTDIQAAQSAGVYTCAVTYGYRPKQELEKLKPDFLIDRMEELKKIIS